MLERLRLRKSPEELAMLRTSSEKVIDAMLATIAQSGPGTTKAEFTETLRREEVNRGTDVRVLPDRGRREPQSRAVAAALGEG